MLGAYEDSDEEDAVESQATATKAKHNQSADIDSTLANFMAVSKTCVYHPCTMSTYILQLIFKICMCFILIWAII